MLPPNGGGGGGSPPLGETGECEGSLGYLRSALDGMRASRDSEPLRRGSSTKPYLQLVSLQLAVRRNSQHGPIEIC